MKKIYIIVAITIFSGAFAQTATINSKKVLASIPEIAKINDLVTKEKEKYIQDFQKKRNEAFKVYKIADSLYKIKPKEEDTKKALEKDKAAQKELQDFQNAANDKITEYKDLLYKPYLEKINNAVKTVATKRKYMQVLDIIEVPFVFVNNAADITEDVINELKKNNK